MGEKTRRPYYKPLDLSMGTPPTPHTPHPTSARSALTTPYESG